MTGAAIAATQGLPAACHSAIGLPDTSRFGAMDTKPEVKAPMIAATAKTNRTWLRMPSRKPRAGGRGAGSAGVVTAENAAI